jgi:hypothetical protein|uniref:Uncharacterized protein n=1 Tax=Podoviridae sp. ctz6O13 TaxID=2827757 RepID=A0A8S5TKD9_9CAUD|nr:MAG TPA: hypothetical protein [Podoviridae sp. ctz6O13]
MIKKKEFYRLGQFIDFEGQIHKFTIAAVVSEIPKDLELFHVKGAKGGHYTSLSSDDMLVGPVKAAVTLGVSICHPDDIAMYNENIGMQIAVNKAMSPKTVVRWLSFNDISTATEKMIDALLENEGERIKTNPDAYIKGYDVAALKYAEKVSLLRDYDLLTEEEKETTKMLIKAKNKKVMANLAQRMTLKDLKDIVGISKKKVKMT